MNGYTFIPTGSADVSPNRSESGSTIVACDESDDMEIDEKEQELSLSVSSSASPADLDHVYQRMSHGQKIMLLSKHEECLNTNKYCKGMNIVIIYTGLCKTRASISDLMSHGINNVVVYNPREISMMQNLIVGYLLKIKLSPMDIGIHYTFIKGITERPMSNLNGIWMTLSKKWFIENMSSRTPRKVDEFSHAVYKEMTSTVIPIIDEFLRNKHQLKFVILDIRDAMDQDANNNQSNVAFKISIYNYILNAGVENCSVV